LRILSVFRVTSVYLRLRYMDPRSHVVLETGRRLESDSSRYFQDSESDYEDSTTSLEVPRSGRASLRGAELTDVVSRDAIARQRGSAWRRRLRQDLLLLLLLLVSLRWQRVVASIIAAALQTS